MAYAEFVANQKNTGNHICVNSAQGNALGSTKNVLLLGIVLEKKYLNVDNHKCQICDEYGDEVDHIKALMNGGEMWDKNNLRTLCNGCHRRKTLEDLRENKRVKNGDTLLIEPCRKTSQ